MAKHIEKYGLHKEAIKETLLAVELWIDYKKEKNSLVWGKEQGCLGYPCLILLFSFINAFGSLFKGQKIEKVKIKGDKTTFQILKSDYFLNQLLETSTIEELYETYRNKLIHNLSLPSNYYIEISSSKDNWYELTKDEKNNDVITIIYLMPLLKLCKTALSKIENEHHLQYINSNIIDDINIKDMPNVHDKIFSIASSGSTSSTRIIKFPSKK